MYFFGKFNSRLWIESHTWTFILSAKPGKSLGAAFYKGPQNIIQCVLRQKLYGRKRKLPRAFWSERQKCIQLLILHHPVEKHFKSWTLTPIRQAMVCRWVLDGHRRSDPNSPASPTCTQPLKGFTLLPQ